MTQSLTPRQREIHELARQLEAEHGYPPTLDDLCRRLGLRSRGSLHKHVQALRRAGLVERTAGRRGIRALANSTPDADGLPLLGRIAAGRPMEAVAEQERMQVPPQLRSERPCFVLQVRGDSMVEAGILDGDYVVVEHCSHARNGEIVVALIEGGDATLKRIEQLPGRVLLHPANAAMEPLSFPPESVQIQGVVVGQMRSYR